MSDIYKSRRSHTHAKAYTSKQCLGRIKYISALTETLLTYRDASKGSASAVQSHMHTHTTMFAKAVLQRSGVAKERL